MKNISTLVKDIDDLFVKSREWAQERVVEFAVRLADRIHHSLSTERGPSALRLSNLGTPCECKLWYAINQPELAEPLPPAARRKFLFGDILEELLLFLAKEAGHTVTDEQKEVDLFGVKGHIDGRIDGHLVDSKSASSYGFDKFAAGLESKTDDFGYLTQLDGYLHADGGDSASFLVIDKTLGKICLDTHPKSDVDYSKEVERKRDMLARPTPPPRRYMDEPDGKSGNRKLGVACSYCSFKYTCWPGIRTFAYSNKPVFLTKVVRLPNVPEITHDAENNLASDA